MKSARCALSLLLAAAVLSLAAASSPPPAKPNLLFILTEDQGAHLGFLGTPGLQTPHMDSLARSGVYFDSAFVAYPVCSASKAALYTALQQWVKDTSDPAVQPPLSLIQ